MKTTLAILSGILLAAAMGCPSSDQKPNKPQSTEPARTSADESTTPPKTPGDEFEQPPALPQTDPPPKLTQDPADDLKTSKTYRPGLIAPPVFEQTAAAPADTRAASFNEPTEQPQKKSAATTAQPKKTATQPRLTKVPRKPFDPIKENGPIFKDWPKPKLAIAITGMELGYIEPCGCAGLERMKGGMGRRYAFFQQLRKDGWPLVALDVGGLARGFGREAEMKFRTLVESKDKMGYNAVGFGADDLRLPAAELVSVAADVNDKPSMFLSANVGLFGFDQKITQTSRVIKAGGLRIGVTAVLGKEYQKEVNKPEVNPEIEMIDPEVALRKIVPDLKQKSDYMILLANTTKAEAVELAKKFPEFNVIALADTPEVPPIEPEAIPGSRTLLIPVGHKGMYVVILGLFDDAKQTVRYQRVPLDSRFTAAPEMKLLMASFQEQLKTIGFAELGLRPAPHPQTATNGRFVGSKKCESCHEKSYDIWKRSGHAKAYETLAKLEPPRNSDPECVSCHVIGWHPTKFFPYQGGFESVAKTPQLINAGCEGCHGPGELHVQAELGNDEALQKKYRKTSVVTKEQSKKEMCATCHDLDNSPDFDFDSYWPLVEHYEKSAEE